METAARVMATATKRARARARVARGMAMATKRAMATDGEGNVNDGKSTDNGNN